MINSMITKWQQELDLVLIKEPTLTANGFDPFPVLNYQDDLETRSNMFSIEVEQFGYACYVLFLASRQSQINYNHSTYSIKHRIENFLKKELDNPSYYVSNGATIAAAIHSGFDYKKPEDGSGGYSAFLNISDNGYKSINFGNLYVD